jgi:hypothetical protein
VAELVTAGVISIVPIVGEFDHWTVLAFTDEVQAEASVLVVVLAPHLQPQAVRVKADALLRIAGTDHGVQILDHGYLQGRNGLRNRCGSTGRRPGSRQDALHAVRVAHTT